MRISFAPQRRDDALTLSVDGDTLTVNGQPLDFSAVIEDAPLPAEETGCDLLVGEVLRATDGVIQVTVILPVGPTPTPEQSFPAPVDIEAGEVPLP